MSGSDEFGQARITFKPTALAVPPGQVGRAIAVIEASRPEGGTSSSRKVQFAATSAAGVIGGEATFTQQAAASNRRLWAVLLVLLGGMLIGLGAVLWSNDDDLGGRTRIQDAVENVVDGAQHAADGGPDVVFATPVGLIIESLDTSFLLDAGVLAIVLPGAVLAFIGGVLLKR